LYSASVSTDFRGWMDSYSGDIQLQLGLNVWWKERARM